VSLIGLNNEHFALAGHSTPQRREHGKVHGGFPFKAVLNTCVLLTATLDSEPVSADKPSVTEIDFTVPRLAKAAGVLDHG